MTPLPGAPTARAEEIVRLFNGRKGFDWWWDSLDEDIQDEIHDELVALLMSQDGGQ